MRKLITSDVFKMARIIKEAKVKGAITEIFKSKAGIKADIKESDSEDVKEAKRKALDEEQKAAGFEAVMTVLEACSTEKLEEMFYEFFGGIVEKTPDAVRKQSLEVTIEEIKAIVENNNIANFFKLAGQSA